MNKNYFDKLNRNWATDEKFKQLGNCFEKLLLDSARDLNITGLKVHKNRPNTQGGTYLYKRFVRVSPKGFHPNGLQIFIESFSEGTSKDSNTRDLSDDWGVVYSIRAGNDGWVDWLDVFCVDLGLCNYWNLRKIVESKCPWICLSNPLCYHGLVSINCH